jgi:FMN phosphatase YigB (HAD superfamily)
VDGVLVNNSANVVDKSVRYLQKHANVPVRYRTYKHMQKTKQTGVQKKPWPHLVHRGTRNGVWEYNNYVFDKDTLLDFVRNAVITIPIDAEYETLQTLSRTRWRGHVCGTLHQHTHGLLLHRVDPDNQRVLHTSDTGFLKPTENFYEHVEYKLGSECSSIHFMDDNARNTTAVQQRALWHPQHVPTRTALFDALGKIRK